MGIYTVNKGACMLALPGQPAPQQLSSRADLSLQDRTKDGCKQPRKTQLQQLLLYAHLYESGRKKLAPETQYCTRHVGYSLKMLERINFPHLGMLVASRPSTL
jgi:hypothetical protein